jgi:hypothetical protein
VVIKHFNLDNRSTCGPLIWSYQLKYIIIHGQINGKLIVIQPTQRGLTMFLNKENIYKIYKLTSSPWKKNSQGKITHGQGGASFYTLDQY